MLVVHVLKEHYRKSMEGVQLTMHRFWPFTTLPDRRTHAPLGGLWRVDLPTSDSEFVFVVFDLMPPEAAVAAKAAGSGSVDFPTFSCALYI